MWQEPDLHVSDQRQDTPDTFPCTHDSKTITHIGIAAKSHEREIRHGSVPPIVQTQYIMTNARFQGACADFIDSPIQKKVFHGSWRKTGNAWGAVPNPGKELRFLHPFLHLSLRDKWMIDCFIRLHVRSLLKSFSAAFLRPLSPPAPADVRRRRRRSPRRGAASNGRPL